MAGYAVGIRNGLITGEHRRRMGAALWEFLWLVDHITEEYSLPDGEIRGKVLGGTVIEADRIATDFDVHRDTVLENLRTLELAGYIVRRRAPRGFRIEVCNSKKWARTPDPDQSLRIGESVSRCVGVLADSPTRPLTGPPAESDGETAESGTGVGSRASEAAVGDGLLDVSESVNRRVGLLADTPTHPPTYSPIALDNAETQDNAEIHCSIQEEDALRIWAAAVSLAQTRASRALVTAMERCRPSQVDGNAITVYAPKVPEHREKLAASAVMLRALVRDTAGRRLDVILRE